MNEVISVRDYALHTATLFGCFDLVGNAPYAVDGRSVSGASVRDLGIKPLDCEGLSGMCIIGATCLIESELVDDLKSYTGWQNRNEFEDELAALLGYETVIGAARNCSRDDVIEACFVVADRYAD
jgi:hypothetical protein